MSVDGIDWRERTIQTLVLQEEKDQVEQKAGRSRNGLDPLGRGESRHLREPFSFLTSILPISVENAALSNSCYTGILAWCPCGTTGHEWIVV